MMYEDYLEHHGVKGMKWGHRKQRLTSGYAVRRRVKTDAQQPQTPEEARRARRRKIAKRVGIGLAAAAAIGATTYAVKRSRSTAPKDFSKSAAKAAQLTQKASTSARTAKVMNRAARVATARSNRLQRKADRATYKHIANIAKNTPLNSKRGAYARYRTWRF